MRRRARFLRRARELAYRDLGGLVFDLHRFGQRNDELVIAKLDTLSRIDGELRGIEQALRERRSVTVLREAGVTACPRCAAIHSNEDRFCPACGLPMSSNAELPIGGLSVTKAAVPAPIEEPKAAPAPTQPKATPAPTQPKATISAPEQPEVAAAAPSSVKPKDEQPTEIIRPEASGA